MSLSKVILLGILKVNLLLSCGYPAQDMASNSQPVRSPKAFKAQRPGAQVVTLKQIERQTFRQEFTIPRFEVFEDEFYQAEESLLAIDILIVVDNSGSMAWAQSNLSSKMNPLLEAVQDISWQIGVINTEWPCFKAAGLPFDISTPHLQKRFSDTIRQGVNGTPYEKAMKMAGLNISRAEYTSTDISSKEYRKTCTPEPWLRKHASLAVLILADEDEDPTSDWSSEMVYKTLEEQGYQPGSNARVSGLIWRPGTECKQAYSEGAQHQQLIEMTGGISGSVCDEDYTQSLKAISANFRDMIHLEYQLREQPLLSSVDITINGSPYFGEYTIVGSKLILANALSLGDRMVVRYKKEEARKLQLRHSASGDTILAMIGDKTMQRDAFRFDPKDRSLNFSEALPEGQTISVEYREDRQLQSNFAFPPRISESSIECYFDGELQDFRYLYEEGLLILAEPHPDATLIHCLYQK